MDPVVSDLITQVESLKMQVEGLKRAICNLQGFYMNPDPSTGNMVQFDKVVPASVEPAIAEVKV